MYNKAEKEMPLETVLSQELTHAHGPLMGGAALWKALGFTSSDAFRQAHSRGLLPVPVFNIPNRRGKFALVHDVARWLAEMRSGVATKKGNAQTP
jgi:hypothetical protein